MYACLTKQRRAIVETTPIVNAKLVCDWSALHANNSFKKFSKKNLKNTVSSVCQALFIHQIFRSIKGYARHNFSAKVRQPLGVLWKQSDLKFVVPTNTQTLHLQTFHLPGNINLMFKSDPIALTCYVSSVGKGTCLEMLHNASLDTLGSLDRYRTLDHACFTRLV